MTHDHQNSHHSHHIASSRYGDMNKSCIDCANSTLSTSDKNDFDMQKNQTVDLISMTRTTTLPADEASFNSDNAASSSIFSNQHKNEGKKRGRRRFLERSPSRSVSIAASSSNGKRSRMERSFSRSSSRPRTFRRHHHHHHKSSRVHCISQERSRSPHRQDSRPRSYSVIPTKQRRNPYYSPLPLEWWERSEECKEAKLAHVDKIDWLCSSREFLVLQTTLLEEDTALEPNMFPYATPPGVKHYTLWSKYELSHYEIIDFVDMWLSKHFPKVRRWQYDDNMGERSILLFHVHVFIEMEPYSFSPRPGLEYFPPHLASGTYLR